MPSIGHVEEAHGQVIDGIYYPYVAAETLQEAPIQEDIEGEETGEETSTVSFGKEVDNISHMMSHLESEQLCYKDVQQEVEGAFAQMGKKEQDF